MSYFMTECYKNFKCIADRCSYTCCKDWSIELDQETYDKYQDNNIKVNFNESDIAVMPHKEDGSCCMLDSCGLCELVKKHGDDSMLSITCKLYPRMATNNGDYIELYLANSCPEVLDIIKKLNHPILFINEEEMDLEFDFDIIKNIRCEDRNTVINILQTHDMPLSAKLYISYLFAKKIDSVQDSIGANNVRKKFNSTEVVTGLYKALEKAEISIEDSFMLKKLLHKNINIFYNKKEMSERLYYDIEKYVDEFNLDMYLESKDDFDNYIKEYDIFFENVAVNMFFYRGCFEDGSKESFKKNTIVMMIEFVIIRFHLCIWWNLNNKMLSWEEIRLITAYYARNIEHGMGGIHKLIDFYFNKKIINEEGLILLK